MRVVTAYTPDYETLALRLIASCDKFGVPFTAIPYESRGTWTHNNNAKPMHILAAFRLHPTESHLWLDADMILTAPLPPFPTADAILYAPAAYSHIYSFTARALIPNTDHIHTPWGGHCAFSPHAIPLIQDWATLCHIHTPATNDEQCLLYALSLHPHIRLAPLPHPDAYLLHSPAGTAHGKPTAWSNI